MLNNKHIFTRHFTEDTISLRKTEEALKELRKNLKIIAEDKMYVEDHIQIAEKMQKDIKIVESRLEYLANLINEFIRDTNKE